VGLLPLQSSVQLNRTLGLGALHGEAQSSTDVRQ
jgi:hypothetical protein